MGFFGAFRVEMDDIHPHRRDFSFVRRENWSWQGFFGHKNGLKQELFLLRTGVVVSVCQKIPIYLNDNVKG